MKQNPSPGRLWHKIAQKIVQPQRDKAAIQTADIQAQVEIAHREWVSAKQYFQSVSEPPLVDHAIYLLEAAERKYMYLLNQLRERKPVEGDQTSWTS